MTGSSAVTPAAVNGSVKTPGSLGLRTMVSGRLSASTRARRSSTEPSGGDPSLRQPVHLSRVTVLCTGRVPGGSRQLPAAMPGTWSLCSHRRVRRQPATATAMPAPGGTGRRWSGRSRRRGSRCKVVNCRADAGETPQGAHSTPLPATGLAAGDSLADLGSCVEASACSRAATPTQGWRRSYSPRTRGNGRRAQLPARLPASAPAVTSCC
jgi:hypothetical protein